MIRLFTGLPGAGKTAHAVAEALKLQAEGRPVFVSNIEDMKIPGAIPLDDPRKWEDLPPNAVLIVDEAQRFWRASRSLDVPPEVQAMETHRHLGIDFLLTTQQPTYLLKHLRGLVGEHTHHLRRTNGTAQTWTWNGCCDDPDNLSERDRGDVGLFAYPKEVFGMYKSTEQDTHRPGIPRRWKFVGIVGALMVALFLFGPDYLKSKTLESSKFGGADGSSAEPPSQGTANLRSKRPATVEEYLAQSQPRHPALPWSAPVFDDRKAVAEPEIYCIASGAGLDAQGQHSPASTHCITEQGTALLVDPVIARRIANSGGVYNPYRQPRQAQQQPQALPGAGQGPAESGAQAPIAAQSAAFASVAAYGKDGIGAY